MCCSCFFSGTAQSPFSADSCLETQQKFIKRKNTCPKDNEPKRRRLSDSESLSMNQQTEQISIDNENEPIVRDEQDLQDHLNNTDSNAKLAKNLTEESSLNIKRQSTEDDNDSQSKLNISSGEMDCEPSVSKLNIESDTAKEDLQHLSNTVSEGSALLSALASTDESSPDIQSNDGDIDFQSKPITADEENGSHVSLDFEHLNKDNYTRRKQCNKIHFAWIFALLIVVFLCIINSGYCPPYLQLLIIILIFISLISLIFVVVTYLFHTMFTADRNGSNQSSVI